MDNIPTGIYIRVSTEDQAKDGFSINAQKEKLTKYAEANDWKIFDYYIDDGISGKNLDGRPEVTRLLNDVESGRINNVLIYKLDRLTRSVRDLIYLIELFEKHNCTFNSQTEKIDTSNAVGRMFVKIIGIFAEFERENLAERVSFGYEQKTREGNYTNTNGVYGYDYIIGEQKIIVNNEEKELVNRIYDLYIDGMSLWKIARLLNMERVKTKRGGNWCANTVKSILNNPLYIGKVRYGVANNLKDRSFEVEGNDVEPIIDKEKWNLARNIVETRKHYQVRRYPSENTYFFHVLRCGECGGKMSARQQKQNGKIYITYSCNNKAKACCKAEGFSHNNMEKAFINYLSNIEKMKPSKEIIELKKINKNVNDEIESINKKLQKFKEKRKVIREQYINDDLDINEFREINNEINDLEKVELEKLEKLKIEKKDEKKLFTYDEVKDIVSDIKTNWIYLTNKEKQQFLERFVDVIKVKKIGSKVNIEEVRYK